jgi:hypothetical protein
MKKNKTKTNKTLSETKNFSKVITILSAAIQLKTSK